MLFKYISTFIVIFLGIVVSLACSKKPHIVFIVADDLGWTDVSYHGSDQIPTPTIDKLAREGIILNNYYVQPICTPSRSALMTGKYPIHTGLFHDVIHPSQPYGLSLDEKILPEYLKELGYATHIIGKWHLGFFEKEYTPTYRGFDSFYGYYNGAEDYFNHTAIGHPFPFTGLDLHYDIEEKLKPVWTQDGNYSSDMYGAEAIDRIRNHKKDTPLFLYVPFQNVHAPLQAPEEWINKFSHIEDDSRRIFAAMVACLDDAILKIYNALLEEKMLDDTLIVFTSDNGGLAEKGFASNYPLRSEKRFVFEGGVRVPAFIHGKSLKLAGHVSTEMMHITDWLPTLVSAAEGKFNASIDGIDQWDALQTGGKSPRNEILVNIDNAFKRTQEALIVGKWKIIRESDQFDSWMIPFGYNASGNATSVVDCGIKPENITHCHEHHCLFDLSIDPCEYNDLSNKYPEVVAELIAKLGEYRKSMVPFRNKLPDVESNPKYNGGAWMPWRPRKSSSTVNSPFSFVLLFVHFPIICLIV